MKAKQKIPISDSEIYYKYFSIINKIYYFRIEKITNEFDLDTNYYNKDYIREIHNLLFFTHLFEFLEFYLEPKKIFKTDIDINKNYVFDINLSKFLDINNLNLLLYFLNNRKEDFSLNYKNFYSSRIRFDFKNFPLCEFINKFTYILHPSTESIVNNFLCCKDNLVKYKFMKFKNNEEKIYEKANLAIEQEKIRIDIMSKFLFILVKDENIEYKKVFYKIMNKFYLFDLEMRDLLSKEYGYCSKYLRINFCNEKTYLKSLTNGEKIDFIIDFNKLNDEKYEKLEKRNFYYNLLNLMKEDFKINDEDFYNEIIMESLIK